MSSRIVVSTLLAGAALAIAGLSAPSPVLAAPAPAAAPAVPQGLLPDVATPLAYRIDLTVAPERERFSGHVEIDVQLKGETRALFLHGRDLRMTAVQARTAGGTIAARYEQVDPLGVARLDFAQALPAGKVTLVFDYDAPFGENAAGLYRAKVADTWYVWSQFESIDARAAFPGFDQPGYKTPFTISLTTPSGDKAFSNAPETETRVAGDMVRHQFAPTRPLPTYLVAFVVGPMAVAEGQAAPTPERAEPMPVRVVATRPNADKLAFALENTGPIVGLLERYFGEPFPFPKLDQIASPLMNGAMENAGADIYGDPILLLGPGPSTAQQRTFGMVVAHELSHQWFGDLVTPKWWDDIWLNESFANWMGYRIGQEWRPDLKIGAGAIDEAFNAMTIDALAAGRPIHQPIATNAEIDSAFDAVTYGKGGQVVAMIAAYLGDEKFQAGVRLHLRRHAYGNAGTDDFFASLADAAQDPRIVAAMRSFVDQQGVPVVRVERDAQGLSVTQSRYHLLGSQVPAEQWSIPLCMRLGGDRQCTLLDQPSARVTMAGDGAIMPNAGGTGYYRFSLSEAEWRRLIAAGAALPPGEALALNDSLWADVAAGHVDPHLLIEAGRAMAGNGYSAAATEAGWRLAGYRQRGLVPDSALPAYHRAIAAIYGPIVTRLGFDPKAGAYGNEDPDVRQLRTESVALLLNEADDAGLRATLADAAKRYLAGDAQALDQSLIGTALQAYVKSGGLSAAEALFARVPSTDDTRLRNAIVSVLGRSGDPAIGAWLTGHLNDKDLRPRDSLGLVFGLASQPATRGAAFDWMMANYEQIVSRSGIFEASRLPTAMAGACSVEEADKVEHAMRPMVERFRRGALELDRALEQIRSCAALKDARGPQFRTMFD